MSDLAIVTGDRLKVTIAPPAVIPVLLAPMPLSGSGRTVTVNGAAICLAGDELPPALRAVLSYTAPPFSNPGTGKLSLILLPTNLSTMTECGKPILLKGTVFSALFTVATPATQATPNGPVPDPAVAKMGTAQFISANTTVSVG